MPTIRLKKGPFELEMDASEDFLAEHFLSILDSIDAGSVMEAQDSDTEVSATPEDAPVPLIVANGHGDLSMNSLVAAFNSKSCRDVLLAAAFHLSALQKKEPFSKSEWEETAKQATIWQVDWSSQKALNRSRLVKAKSIIENSNNKYSMNPALKAEMEGKLA